MPETTAASAKGSSGERIGVAGSYVVSVKDPASASVESGRYDSRVGSSPTSASTLPGGRAGTLHSLTSTMSGPVNSSNVAPGWGVAQPRETTTSSGAGSAP